MTVFERSAPTRLGPECAGMQMTHAEFDAVDDWDPNYRYELLHGILVVSPAPSPGERSPNGVLEYLLRNYQRECPDSTMDDTLFEHDVRTSAGTRRADRAIWAGLGRAPEPGVDLPTILVELVSATSRDRHRDYVEKRAEYAALGIAEYWVFDRFDRSLTVCRPGADDMVVREGEVYTTNLLPGFELELDELLEAADRYARPGE